MSLNSFSYILLSDTMTRIFSASSNISNLDITKIEEYKSKSKRDTLFYSESGIFSMYKNELVKHIYTDVDLIKYTIDNIKLVADNSNIQKRRSYYQLPNNYVVKRNDIIEYKLAANSDIKLIITLENNIPCDMYFYTKKDHTHPEVQGAVTTFLSALNFY